VPQVSGPCSNQLCTAVTRQCIVSFSISDCRSEVPVINCGSSYLWRPYSTAGRIFQSVSAVFQPTCCVSSCSCVKVQAYRQSPVIILCVCLPVVCCCSRTPYQFATAAGLCSFVINPAIKEYLGLRLSTSTRLRPGPKGPQSLYLACWQRHLLAVSVCCFGAGAVQGLCLLVGVL